MKSQSPETAVVRRSIAALVVSVATVVASCAPQPPPELDYMRVSIDGQPTLGIVKRDVEARGVVVFFHGLDHQEYSLIEDEPHQELTETLVNAGFAVVASKAGGNAYGNSASQRNYRELAKEAVEHYRVANVFLLAESMGAIAAANLLASGDPPQMLGLAAISPVLNLAHPPAEHREAIALSFPDKSIESVDPIGLPTDNFQSKKIRIYASPEDPLVSRDANALAFQARFGQVADISMVSCTGPHGDPSCVQADDLVKWFTQLESDAE
ncbi:alpha/beta hydrolase [Mycobacterium sp. PS03-16]|uniref:serine aminopeptidase domain-containing protein n=1 Tax=Mycobacterium sp. PS03-16 TaxID=2559611 RepID=UPI0010731649|nr:alpha/beta hydrolase [Mycobacterium sp. PS03-16]TFV59921.1 alpha/beta hydrolase [Mycobacterium sp. PS03-16]